MSRSIPEVRAAQAVRYRARRYQRLVAAGLCAWPGACVGRAAGIRVERPHTLCELHRTRAGRRSTPAT